MPRKRDTLTLCNVTQGIDDDALAALNLDNLGRAIWHATMVDEPCDATFLGRVDDGVVVDSEEITAANTALKVSIFAKLSNLLTNLLADVLNDHLVFGNVLHRVQSPVVDRGPREFDGLLSFLKLIEPQHVRVLSESLSLVVEVLYEATIVDTISTGVTLGHEALGSESSGFSGGSGRVFATLARLRLKLLPCLLDLDVVR